MTEVKSLERLSLVLGYLVPGLIIIYVRAQFLTGRLLPHKEAILSYFTLSVIYLAIVEAITSLITGSWSPLFRQTPYWLPIMLGGSAVFGTLIGVNAMAAPVGYWRSSECMCRTPSQAHGIGGFRDSPNAWSPSH